MPGDRIQCVTKSLSNVGIEYADEVIVTSTRNSPQGYNQQVMINYEWLHHSHFRLVEAAPDKKVSIPQPHLFKNGYEAARDRIIQVGGEYAARVSVQANGNPDPDHTDEDRRERNIYLYVDPESGGTLGHTVMSIEEATEVAVALFDQILYHTHLRSQRDRPDSE